MQKDQCFRMTTNYQSSARESLEIIFMQCDLNNNNFSIIENEEKEMKVLDEEEWKKIIQEKSFSGFSKSRIHFSFLKGLPNRLRWEIWMMLAEIDRYQEGEEYVKLHESVRVNLQIDADIPRTIDDVEIEKRFVHALKRILYAASSLNVEYIQGMNFIVLNLMKFCCKSLEMKNQPLDDPKIQQQILGVFMHILNQLQLVFGQNQQGIFTVISQLQTKICQSQPAILFHIAKYELDCMTLFNQHYFCLMLYNKPPDSFALSLLDLFFLQGRKAIDIIIIRMLQACEQQILSFRNSYDLQKFLKKQIFQVCSKKLEQQRVEATKLTDFELCFYSIQKI